MFSFTLLLFVYSFSFADGRDLAAVTKNIQIHFSSWLHENNVDCRGVL
jgi:hypothetical protein